MDGMSDLDLVAQAMAPTTQSTPHAIQSTQPPHTSPPNPPSTHDPSPAQPPSLNGQEPLSTQETLISLGIDPSTLSATDLEALQPILNALSLGAEGESEDDELRITEILAQMDAAGSVADDLEGKLDELLANLGETEKQMQAALPSGRQEKKQ